MLETMKKIKRMNIKGPEQRQDAIKLNKNIFFNFEKKEMKQTATNLAFVEKMKENCDTDMNEFGDFGSFFFDLNGACLEIFLTLEDENITVIPYLVYDKEIKQSIQKVVYREFFLYCLFKKYGLQ